MIHGGEGHDAIRAGDGADIVYGGNGDDILSGGQGDDSLYGEAGNDELYGDDGDDTLFGGPGDDFLNGGGLHDLCDGGPGSDVFLMCENVPDSYCHAATYEAEVMSHSTGASTPGGWNLWSNGSIWSEHDFTEGLANVWIIAKGEHSGGAWPQMRVWVGDQAIAQFTVDQPTWTTYWASFVASGATEEVRVEFDNDFFGGSGDDRNLLVDSVAIDCAPQAAPPVYDFESGVMGWTNLSNPAASSATSTTHAYEGNQSLVVQVNGAGDPVVSVAPVYSPVAGASVTLRAYLPHDAPVVATSPYVLDQNWVWADGYTASVDKGSWQAYTVTVPAGAALPLQRIGVKFHMNGSYSGPLYVDAVSW